MIGSGIFIVTSIMARDIGGAGWILLAWILTGFLTLAAALSYGELAGMMPKAGGQYVYIQRAYGKMMSFLYGWTVFTVVQTGVIAAVAVAFAKYTAIFFPTLSENVLEIGTYKIQYQQLLAILSIVILTIINNQGVKTGKNLQFIFTTTPHQQTHTQPLPLSLHFLATQKFSASSKSQGLAATCIRSMKTTCSALVVTPPWPRHGILVGASSAKSPSSLALSWPFST